MMRRERWRQMPVYRVDSATGFFDSATGVKAETTQFTRKRQPGTQSSGHISDTQSGSAAGEHRGKINTSALVYQYGTSICTDPHD